MKRQIKQIFIVVIYLILFFMFFWGVYKLFFYTAPTCNDGKLNQKEVGIDCGGPCQKCPEPIKAQNLQTLSTNFIQAGQNVYDVLVRVKNPNDLYGSSRFDYRIILKDAGGQVLSERSGQRFILPFEEKNIIETNLSTAGLPSAVEFLVDDGNAVWVDFIGYQKPQLNIINKNYSQNSDGIAFGRATGMLMNKGPEDFRDIRINVVLRDADKRPIAVNSTKMSSVDSGSQRDFSLTWPTAFGGEVSFVDMETEVNIFDPEAITKKFLPGGDFQK